VKDCEEHATAIGVAVICTVAKQIFGGFETRFCIIELLFPPELSLEELERP